METGCRNFKLVRITMKIKVVIIDYGIGNTHSVYNALTFLGFNSIISNKKSDLDSSNALILPGVGAFGKAMENIRKKNLDEHLFEQVVHKKKPILGICLGMQLFANSSEEGGYFTGLNWIDGKVKKLIQAKDYSIPNVGWSAVSFLQKDPLFSKLHESSLFYLDHSYHFVCDKKFIAATCNYNVPVVAAVQKENIFGVQFHPEKSQNNGLRLLRSFFNYIN